MQQITGGCLCGEVRYNANVEPAFIGLCHCRNCQKESGSAFAIVVGIPQAALSVQGELKTYKDTGDTGKAMFRRFCPNCGSTVVDEAEMMPGVLMLQVGTLDDPSWVKPTMEIYCDSAQPWVQLGGEMQRFAKMPG
ncbi:MAG TPA: GFA family protein [Acetobacteraceae bacterium]|nr:GFA family protein [Acetobacteraceae bacterium]